MWSIKDVPCTNPSTNTTAGIGLPPFQGRAGSKNWTGRTSRRGLLSFRLGSEGKNVSTISRVEASCNFQENGRAPPNMSTPRPWQKISVAPSAPVDYDLDFDHVKARSLCLLSYPHMITGSLPACLNQLYSRTRDPFHSSCFGLGCSSVNNRMVSLHPPASIRKSTAQRETT